MKLNKIKTKTIHRANQIAPQQNKDNLRTAKKQGGAENTDLQNFMLSLNRLPLGEGVDLEPKSLVLL